MVFTIRKIDLDIGFKFDPVQMPTNKLSRIKAIFFLPREQFSIEAKLFNIRIHKILLRRRYTLLIVFRRKYTNQQNQQATAIVYYIMSENNRIPKNLKSSLTKKKKNQALQPITGPLQPEPNPCLLKSIQIPQSQESKQQLMELPVTHNQSLGYLKQQLGNSRILSQMQSNEIGQSEGSVHSQSQLAIENKTILNKLPQMYKKYLDVLQKINNTNVLNYKRIQISKQCIAQLYQLYKQCIQASIQLSPYAIVKLQQNRQKRSNARTTEKEKETDEIDFINLFINLCLNLWKLKTENQPEVGNDQSKKLKLNQKDDKISQSWIGNRVPIMDILKNCCMKVLSILNIPLNSKNNGKQYPNYVHILPNQTRNKFILLLIIYAKEELAEGNPGQALKYCNVCTYSLVTNQSNQIGYAVISEQNKFKLHYLRVKIFNSLKMAKEQLQQIIICQQLAKNPNVRGILKKDTKSYKCAQQKERINVNVYQLDDNKSINHEKNLLIKKLQKRKDQLVNIQRRNTNTKNYSRSIQNDKNNKQQSSEHQNGLKSSHQKNKLKEVRDSLQINDKTQYSFNRNQNKSLKNIRSNSTNNPHKMSHLTNSNVNLIKMKDKYKKQYKNQWNTNEQQQGESAQQQEEPNDQKSNDQNEIMFKKTYKQNFTQFIKNHNPQISKYPHTIDGMKATLNKFSSFHNSSISPNDNTQINKNNILQVSQSLSKLQRQSSHNFNGKSNEPKQKYELKSKKLTKRALKITNKNKQYENILREIQSQAQGYTPLNYAQINSNSNNVLQYKSVSGSTYMQLLAKRPQSTHQSKINKKQSKNQVFYNVENDLEIQNSQLESSDKANQLRHVQQEQKNPKDPRYSKSSENLNEKILEQCINIVQKQTFQKYRLKLSSKEVERKKEQQKNYSQSNLQVDISEQSSLDSVQSELRSEVDMQISKERNKQEKQVEYQGINGKQMKYLHNFDEKTMMEHNEPPLNVIIENIIFPGLGKCDSIKISIKKIKLNPQQKNETLLVSKELNKNSELEQKCICIMKINIVCFSGIYCFVHGISQLTLPNMTISQMIKRKIKAKLLSLMVNGQQVKTQQELGNQKQQILLKKRILEYVKKNIVVSNKGLGLHLQYKKPEQKKKQQEKEDLFKKMSTFSRIYQQNKNSLAYLFSQQNQCSLNGVTVINMSEKSFKSNQNTNNKEQLNNYEDKLGIIEKLKVLYITIQKKSKSKNKKAQNNEKLEEKNHPLKEKKKKQRSLSQQIIKQTTMRQRQQRSQNKQKLIEKQNLIEKQKLIEPLLKQNKNISHQHRNSIGSILVPVVRYILMGQTSKPKHKLKTILIKANQYDELISSNADYPQNQSEGDKYKNLKSSRFGLLTQYIDDENTIKIKPISTNVYEQTIGKFFMDIGKRKNSKFQTNFPEDFMLSLKCYLMISKHTHHKDSYRLESYNLMKKYEKKNLKASGSIGSEMQKMETTNVIDRFFEKFRYSFIVGLKKNYELSQNLQNYIVTATFYRVKKLYRAGYQKFYMLKYQISQRNARTRLDQFIMTSFDIKEHFQGLQLDLTEIQQKQQFINNFEGEYERKRNIWECKLDRQGIKKKQAFQQKEQVEENAIHLQAPEISLKKPNKISNSNENYLKKDIKIDNNSCTQTQQIYRNRNQKRKSIESDKCDRQEIKSNLATGRSKIQQQRPIKQTQIQPQLNEARGNKNKTKKNKIIYEVQQKKTVQQAISQDTAPGNMINRLAYLKENDQVRSQINSQGYVQVRDSTREINNEIQACMTTSNRLSCPQNRQIRYLASDLRQKVKILSSYQISQELGQQNQLRSMNSQNVQFEDQKDSIIENLEFTHNRTGSHDIYSNNEASSNSNNLRNNNSEFFKINSANLINKFGLNSNKEKTNLINRNKNKRLSTIDQNQGNQLNVISTDIAEGLKMISSRILLFKSQLYTSIGILSNPNHHYQNQLYYANKFRFSRNKLKQFSGQFLSPHLKSLEIIFQKTIKIQCDSIFAVLTVLKVENSSQFYIKIYIPETQKIMSFSVNYSVFEYFSKEQLEKIFYPYIKFDYQSVKKEEEQNISKEKTNKEVKQKQNIMKVQSCNLNRKRVKKSKQLSFIDSQLPSSRSKRIDKMCIQDKLIQKHNEQKQKHLEIKHMVSKIEMYFNSKFQCSDRSFLEKENVQNQDKLHDKQISITNINEVQNQSSQGSSRILSTDLNVKNQTKKPSLFKGQNNLNLPQLKDFRTLPQNKCSSKVIWSKILKFIKFQRRKSSLKAKELNEGDQHMVKSYLVAKIGNYEAFVKDFSIQEHIIVNRGNEKVIFKVEISMEQKLDGLNFIQKSKHTELLKRSMKKKSKRKGKQIIKMQQKKQEIEMAIKKPKQKNIYESQSNKQIIYITITQTDTEQKVCFSYYLCELLHLIDYNEIEGSKKNIQLDLQEEGFENVNNYRVESKQFKQIILNYAVLFKVLSYIKNQYIIELKNNSSKYVKQIFVNQTAKYTLKTNVDKILLSQYSKKHRTSLDRKQSKPIKKQQNEQIEQDIFKKIFKNLLNSATVEEPQVENDLSFEENASEKDKKNSLGDRYKKEAKITFNEKICNQKQTDISFLVRKVISRKNNPIACIFYNQIAQKFVIYLTNYKKGSIKEIQLMLYQHSMPFINIINIIQNEQINQNDCDSSNNKVRSNQIQKRKKKERDFLLAFRARLLKYHHNMILLTSV